MAKSGTMRKSPQKKDMRGMSLPTPAAGTKVGRGVEPALYTGPKGAKGPKRKAGT